MSFVGYSSTDTQTEGGEHAFWTAPDRVVKKVPGQEQMFVLLDANARMERREGYRLGIGKFIISGTYGRDTLDYNAVRPFLIFCLSEVCTVEYVLQHRKERNLANVQRATQKRN